MLAVYRNEGFLDSEGNEYLNMRISKRQYRAIAGRLTDKTLSKIEQEARSTVAELMGSST